MKQKITMKLTLLFIAALGLALTASAQDADSSATAPPATAASATGLGHGLLGQNYAGFTYTYTDIQHTSLNNQGLGFVYNEPVASGLDAMFTYDGARSARFAGTDNLSQLVLGSAVAYLPGYERVRPFVTIGAGWIWTRTWHVSDSSFAGQLGTGVEFLVAPNLSLRPYVDYTYARVFDARRRWDYGLEANYWLTQHWGVTATLDRDNQRNMSYTAGVNFRF